MKLLPLIVLFCSVLVLDWLPYTGVLIYYIRHIIFYSFWIYLGLFYNSNLSVSIRRNYTLLITICSYLIVFLLTKLGYSIDMQLNKFPPTFIFLILNIGTITLIYSYKDKITFLFRKLKIEQYVLELGKKSYTVYLYQSFTFLIGGIIVNKFIIDLTHNELVLALFYITINLIFSKIYIYMFGKIENISVMRKKH